MTQTHLQKLRITAYATHTEIDLSSLFEVERTREREREREYTHVEDVLRSPKKKRGLKLVQ